MRKEAWEGNYFIFCLNLCNIFALVRVSAQIIFEGILFVIFSSYIEPQLPRESELSRDHVFPGERKLKLRPMLWRQKISQPKSFKE